MPSRKSSSDSRTRRLRKAPLRLAGVELYFDDLKRAKDFYRETLGLAIADEQAGHYAKFTGGAGFLCLERKGAESYPSRDKAALFFEVSNLGATVKRIGRRRMVHYEPRAAGRRPAWAVLSDPEGHNVLLLEAKQR